MILIRPARSAYDTTSNRPLKDWPIETNRDSEVECAGSSMVTSSGSMKTVAASSNETLCFRWLRRFLPSSHSTSNVVLPGFIPPAFLTVLVLFSSSNENERVQVKCKSSGIGWGRTAKSQTAENGNGERATLRLPLPRFPFPWFREPH